MNQAPSMLKLFLSFRPTTFTSILIGGGIANAVFRKEYLELPFAVFTPGLYTGYQIIQAFYHSKSDQQ